MSELSPEARALFASARRAGAPPADAQARIREALRAQGPRPVVKAQTFPVAAKVLSAVAVGGSANQLQSALKSLSIAATSAVSASTRTS